MGYAAEQAEDFGGELVTVDDLQVAAAAAAAAMGESSSEEETSSGSEEESDDSSDDDRDNSSSGSSSSSEDEAEQVAPAAEGHGIEYLAAVNAEEFEEESDLDSDDDEEILEIHSYEDLRRVVDQMDSGGGAGFGNGDEDAGHDNGGGGTGPSAAEALFGDVPLPLLDNINITSDDAITLAGTVLSIIEGTVVVRAAPGSRALNEGSILVLEDRSILGVVEDIFGPVQAPLYALRYIGNSTSNVAAKGEVAKKEESENENDKEEEQQEQKQNALGERVELETPEDAVGTAQEAENKVKPGIVPLLQQELPALESKVYSVDRFADFVAEENLRVKGYDGDLAEETGVELAATGGVIDPEQEFSDDEAEAQYKRKLKAKRKANGAREVAVSHDETGTAAAAAAGKQSSSSRQRSTSNNTIGGGANTTYGRGRGGRGGGGRGGGPYQPKYNNGNYYYGGGGGQQPYPHQFPQQGQYIQQGGYPGGVYQQPHPPPPSYSFPQLLGGGGGAYYPPGPPPPPGKHPHQHQQQYIPGHQGPPQLLGQYYAQGAPQYYPPHPQQQRQMGGNGGGGKQFHANATAGQFRAISLQPHHVHPGYTGGAFAPRPPPPQGAGVAGEGPSPPPLGQ
jgi:H/ACA ribonucleoprotein complex non-core subunit NAF1